LLAHLPISSIIHIYRKNSKQFLWKFSKKFVIYIYLHKKFDLRFDKHETGRINLLKGGGYDMIKARIRYNNRGIGESRAHDNVLKNDHEDRKF